MTSVKKISSSLHLQFVRRAHSKWRMVREVRPRREASDAAKLANGTPDGIKVRAPVRHSPWFNEQRRHLMGKQNNRRGTWAALPTDIADDDGHRQ
jgi:hypothetical protein